MGESRGEKNKTVVLHCVRGREGGGSQTRSAMLTGLMSPEKVDNRKCQVTLSDSQMWLWHSLRTLQNVLAFGLV